MQKTFLETNPFYILEVSPVDKRTAIIAKAEEKAFFADNNECEEAQARLLNPEKRLSAELDWFIQNSSEQLADIYNSIAQVKAILTTGLDGVSLLNATLYNFSISYYENTGELGNSILELDKIYNGIDLAELLNNINACREQMGMRSASGEELEREFNKKRDHIRQLISEKLGNLSEEAYVSFITMIADKCLADQDYNDGIIVSDVIDQYELKMQNSIESAADKIYAHIEQCKQSTNDANLESMVSQLVQKVRSWDRLVQPLQLRSMASGISHAGSESIGRALHEFSVWLHNDKELSLVALSLVEEIRPIFAEMSELSDVFTSDSQSLAKIIHSNEDAKHLAADLELIKLAASSIKSYPSQSKVNEFIAQIKSANQKVKALGLDPKVAQPVRLSICLIARDVAITLHNQKAKTQLASDISTMLLKEFGDIAELKPKLSQDVLALQMQLVGSNRSYPYQGNRNSRNTAGGCGCLVWFGIIILILLISSVLSRCDSTDNSKPNHSSNYNYSSNSNNSNNSNNSSNITQYNVSFYKQGGTGGTASITATYGEPMPKATAPTRNGYIFKGYYSRSNGYGTQYYDANMNSVHQWDRLSGGVLYAHWERIEVSQFTSASAVGDDVYVDIISIFPAIGIYPEISVNYTDFVCRCQTTSGSTVWVYMTTSEYRRHFDSDASTGIFDLYAEEITFTSPKRILGVVKRCDSVLSGLSADTGTTLLINFGSVE